MIYVPQFKAPTPAGFRDFDFDHFYDGTSLGPYYLPQLIRVPGDPNPTTNIPLRLDRDAPFVWRAIKFEEGKKNFGIRLRDPFGNFFCPDDAFVPVWLRAYQPQDSAQLGSGPGCIFEPETECPAQSVIYLDIYSFDSVPWQSGGPNKVWLTGVKRVKDGGACGGEVICG